MKKMRYWLWLAAITAMTFVSGAELTMNGDFAKLDAQGFPERWVKIAAGGARATNVAGPDGQEVPVLFFDLDGGPITRIEQNHTLVPGREYKVSFEAKSENLSSAGVYLTTTRWSGGGSQALKGTTPWKHYEFTVKFPGADNLYRLILYAPKGATGKVWFRRIQVTEIIAATDSPEPLLGVARIKTAPVIDGKLDDPAWREAIAATPFVRLGEYQYSQFAADQTEFMLMTDGDFLYAGFRCFQQCLDPVRNKLDAFKNTQRTADGDLFKDDCVILLLQPDAADGAAPVYEFTVNASGTLADAVCRGPELWIGRDLGFNSKARTAGYVGDGFYSVEIAIPLQAAGLAFNTGKPFRVLAGRLNQDARERTVYFPAAKGFHIREAMGRAEWLADTCGFERFQTGLTGSGDRQLSVTARQPAELTIQSRGEDEKTGRLTRELTVGNNTLSYSLPGQEYNTVHYAFRRDGRTAWQTPAYTVGNAVSRTQITVGSHTTVFSAEKGLYPEKIAGTPFQLRREGTAASFEFARVPECLAVDQTLFWPENNREWYIAENSIQPLHIVASTPEAKLAGQPYAFHLVLPRELKLLSATATQASPYRPAFTAPETLTVAGEPYDHYTIKLPIPQPCKAAPDAADLLTLLIETPASGREFPRQPVNAYYFAEWDNGRILETPEVLTVRFCPPLAGKSPKLFRAEMWGGRMVNLADTETNLAFLNRSVKGSGFNQIQNFRVPEMKRMGVMSLKRLLSGKAKTLIEQHPEMRKIDVQGNAVDFNQYNFACTDAMLNQAELQAAMAEVLARGFAEYDVINYDYESPARDGVLSCYCPRCRAAFARFAKLDHTPEIAEIGTQYSNQWIDFMTTRLAESCSLFRAMANKIGKEFTFYSGYQSEKTLYYYTVDWRKLAGRVDFGSAGYWTPAATIAETVKALNGTPLWCGVITEPWHEYSRQKSLQIPLSELFVGLVAGGKGFLCYNLPGVDGRSFHSFSQFCAFLSDHEAVLYHGNRSQDGVKLAGIPNDAWTVFSAAEGSEKILAAYNNSARPAAIKIEWPGIGNGTEYFTGKTFSDPAFEFELPPYSAAAFLSH